MLAGRMLQESVEHSQQWICLGRPNFSLGLFIFSASTAPSGCMGWSCWSRLLPWYFLRSFLHDVLITSHRSHRLSQIFVLIQGGLRCSEYSWEQGRELGRHWGEDGGQGGWEGEYRRKKMRRNTEARKLRRGEKLKKNKRKGKQRGLVQFLVMYSVQCLIWSSPLRQKQY